MHLNNGIRWWESRLFCEALLAGSARRRAQRFGQPQLQENSWDVVGEHIHPPLNSIHRSLSLTIQKPWGQLACCVPSWWRSQAGKACWLFYLKAGSVWVLFCYCLLNADGASTFYLCYRCFFTPHNTLWGGCNSHFIKNWDSEKLMSWWTRGRVRIQIHIHLSPQTVHFPLSMWPISPTVLLHLSCLG